MTDKQLRPIDKEILRALEKSRIKVTPSQISKAINIHPETAKIHIKELAKRNIVECKPVGNRMYCKIPDKLRGRK